MGRRIRGLILVAALIAVGVFAGSALSQWWEVPGAGATATAVRAVATPLTRERVRVEVLNAGGRPNLARSATDALRDVGFDVVYFGNADRFDQDTSVVLDRVGSLERARAVADALGIREVRSEPDSNLFVDVSVVLGGEWEAPASPLPPAVDTTAAPAWWDPRRFLPPPDAPDVSRPSGTLANPTGTEGSR